MSTFYISQKMAPPVRRSSATSSKESQFKAAYNLELGAALPLVLMVMVLVSQSNRFSDEEEVATI